jgi:hypothetical protein
VIHADKLIAGFGQRGDGFLQDIQLLLGRRQIGIFDFALGGKERRQMRIVKDAQAVRVEFGHALQRKGEAFRRLLWQAVNQVNIGRGKPMSRAWLSKAKIKSSSCSRFTRR